MVNMDYMKEIEQYDKERKYLFSAVKETKKYKDISSGIVFEPDSDESKIRAVCSEFDCLLSGIRQNNFADKGDFNTVKRCYDEINNLYNKINWKK